MQSAPQNGKVWVRVCHWVVAASFLTLAVTGFLILMVHPRLYWGEVGNDLTPALLELPISDNRVLQSAIDLLLKPTRLTARSRS